jgi:hypothetical protein
MSWRRVWLAVLRTMWAGVSSVIPPTTCCTGAAETIDFAARKGRTNRDAKYHQQSALVSLAATLSRPISDTHGRLSFQRCALPAICRSPWAKTRNEIIRVGVLQFFIAARFVNLAVSLPQYQFASHNLALVVITHSRSDSVTKITLTQK